MQNLFNCLLNICFIKSLEEFSEDLDKLDFQEVEIVFNLLIVRDRQIEREPLVPEKLYIAKKRFLKLLDIRIKEFKRLLPYI